MDLQHYTLANGLRVVLNEDHSAPLVAVNIWYHVGSKNERPGRTGFAHLFEHMLFSGSEHVGNNEHFRHVQSVGGLLNGSTTFDRTNYYETMPSNYLELALWLESDRMGFFLPALTEEKLNLQRDVVKEERRLRYDNVPYGTAFEEMLRLAYRPDYPYHWPTIGSMEDLSAATVDDVREFFRTWYAPNNAVLTLVGDFDPGEAKQMIERYFGDIPRGPESQRFNQELGRNLSERREIINSDIQLPRLYRFYHLPPFGDREWIAGDLLSSILGGGKASRLEKSLVYEKQIAQDSAAFVLHTEATGMLLLWATAKESVELSDVEKSLDEELARVIDEGVTEEELRRARNQNATDFAHQLENYGMRADLIGMFTTFFDDPSVIDRWLDKYDGISTDDIRDAAVKFLDRDLSVNIEYHPRAAGETA